MAGEKIETKQAPSASSGATGASSDSKLWAALCYVFPVLMFIIVFLTEKKNDKFVLFHAWQSLIGGIGIWVVCMVLAVVTFGIGVIFFPLVWLGFLYLAYKAYQGERFVLPIVGEFAEKQMK